MRVPPTSPDLAALEREIAALMRAGVPLESGLRRFSVGLPGRHSRRAQRVAARLEQGIPLGTALADEDPAYASVCQAVVEAGSRAGRLPAALEALAESTIQLGALRRYVALSMIHPALVALLMYAMVLIWGTWTLPVALDAAETFRLQETPQYSVLKQLLSHQGAIVIGVPIILTVLLAGAWRMTTGWSDSAISQDLNMAQFAEVLLLQVEQGLPLAESFVRAAEATGGAQLRAGAAVIAEGLRQGRSFADLLRESSALSPLMRWSLTAAEPQAGLPQVLRRLRDQCRMRIDRRLRRLRLWIPPALIFCVSGPLVLLYGSAVFWLISLFWSGLSGN